MRPHRFGEPVPRFSAPVFWAILEQWRDWRRGIPPSSAWKGRGAQNPRLLAAFDRLDTARDRVERELREEAERERRRELERRG